MDGGSRDGTLEYLLTHQRDLAWWRSAPDRGLYDAMNIGLSAATGEYLIFLNAGDTLPERGTLEHLRSTDPRRRTSGLHLWRRAGARHRQPPADQAGAIPSLQVVRHVHSPPSDGLSPRRGRGAMVRPHLENRSGLCFYARHPIQKRPSRTRRSSACVVRGRRTLSDTGGAGPTGAGANSPQPSQHVRCFLLFNNDCAICCDIDTSVMAGGIRNMAMPPDVRVAKTPLTRVVCAKPVLRLFRSANQIRVRSTGCATLVNIHAKGLDI